MFRAIDIGGNAEIADLQDLWVSAPYLWACALTGINPVILAIFPPLNSYKFIKEDIEMRLLKPQENVDKELRSNALEKCPQCGSAEWRPIGLPGFFWRGLLMLPFSLLGLLIGASAMKRRKDNDPFILKCEGCGKKWKSAPSNATQEECLEFPCDITVSRPKSFVGAAMSYFMFLNGIRMGVLKNGGCLNFQTNVRHNIFYAADVSGAVFVDYRRFEAEPNGRITFNFNRKFL
jgi:hypothetical protein